MSPDYRKALLANLSRLDQHVADAEWILTQTANAEIGAMTEELRELNVEMQTIEAKLENDESMRRRVWSLLVRSFDF